MPHRRSFGLRDYWRMYQARGVRLPWSYFLNSHLFDLVNRTDTHRWMLLEDFQDRPPNAEHGHYYMCSWTNEIIRVFDTLRDLTGRHFPELTFIDVGCGKGKTVLVWEKQLRRHGIDQRVIGLDYHRELVEVARANHQRVFGTPGEFVVQDAAAFDFSQFDGGSILYMYNPFDADLLEEVIRRARPSAQWIVYYYPVHAELLLQLGYEAAWKREGFHPNAQVTIYRRTD